MPFVMQDTTNDPSDVGDARQTFKARPVIPAGEILVAEIVNCEVRDSIFDLDDNDPSKGKKKEVSFRFKITDDRFPEYQGKTLFGSTPTTFTNHENCKLRLWVQEIYGTDIDAGFAFDEKDLIAMSVRVIIGNRNGRDKATGKSVIKDYVDSLFRVKTFEDSFDAF